MKIENERLKNDAWREWGPYVSNRQWGNVREDYSHDGNAWESTSHDEAESKVFRWAEEGIAGLSDSKQLLCFAFSFWNKQDKVVKERFFGVSNYQGNHGEDVKEYYYYLDNTPTHSYMKMLYKYPQNEFPYQDLISKKIFLKSSGEIRDFLFLKLNLSYNIAPNYFINLFIPSNLI